MATNEQAVRIIPKRTHSYNNAPLNSNNGRRNSNPVTPNDIHVTDTGIVREKQGKVYCDNKPPKVELITNGDFSIESPELITDGDFPEGTRAWSFSGGSQLTTEGARINNTVTGTNSYIYQTLTGSPSGKQFVLTYDVIITNGKTLALEQANVFPLNTSTTGTNRKLYFTWNRVNNGLVVKRLTTGTDVTVDNISLKELGQDWSLGGGWGIGSGVATHNGSTNANISQNVPLVVGTAYDITYTVVNASAGSQIGIAPNSLNIQYPRTSDGTYTETFTASLTNLYIRSLWNNGNPVSVDNISLSRTVLETEYLYHEVLVRDEFNNLVALVRNSNEGDISTGSYENNQGVKNRPIPRTSRIDGRPSRNFNADGSKTL